MDKRVFLTVLVCLGILLFWNTFVAPPKPQTRKAPASAPVATNADSASAPTVASAPASAPASQAAVEEKIVELDSDHFSAKLSTLGAAVTGFTLKDYKELGADKQKHPVNLVQSVQNETVRALSLELGGEPFPFASAERVPGGLSFRGDAHGLRAQATWRVHPEQAYVLTLQVELENVSQAPAPIDPVLRVQGVFNERTVKDKSFLAPPPDVLTPVMSVDGSLKKHATGKKDTPDKTSALNWAGVDRQYFLIAAAPRAGRVAGAEFSETRVKSAPDLMYMTSSVRGESLALPPGGKTSLEYRVFAGPKVAKLLRAPDVGFEDAIDYNVLGMPLGFLSRPMLWILNQAYGLVGSYGWAIALLTLIVKLILLPVTQKSFVSMQVMKEMKPDLDKIKERFPGDREKQGMETMRLYKERGVNPFLSGCLPALLQMPVYFALWRTLWAAVELYQQEFLWFRDLTQPDPYFIVPALLGVTMFVQQKLSPPAGDPQQQKVMLYMMPPLMTSFMLFLPAGLVFYIFVNTILTILQQAYISKKFRKTPVPAAA